jgi:hypothetical protein
MFDKMGLTAIVQKLPYSVCYPRPLVDQIL